MNPANSNASQETAKQKISTIDLTLIKTASDYWKVAFPLSTEERSLLFNSMKDRIRTLIRDAWDFELMLMYVPEEQRSFVFITMETQLPFFINCAWDVEKILSQLSVEQRSVVYNAIKDRIPTFIQNPMDIGRILKYLSLERSALIKESISTYIKSVDDLNCALLVLPPDRCSVVCTLFKEHILSLIKNIDDLKRLSQEFYVPNISFIKLDLWSEQWGALCAVIKEHLVTLIRNRDDLDKMLRNLSKEKQIALCISLGHLHKLISTHEGEEPTFYRFSDPAQKRIIHEHLFHCLVQEIQVKANEFKCRGFVAAHQAAEGLFQDLQQISKNYFGNNPVQPAMNYDQFKLACDAAIDRAGELRNHRGWTEFFAQLILGIASLGVIPVALSVANKVLTGNWKYSLFETDSSKKTNDIRDIVNRLQI